MVDADDKGVHNLKSMEEYKKALAEPGVMVVDCFAVWCGPCKVIAPKVVEFSQAYKKARFYKIDVDAVPGVAQELGVRAMPTFMVFKDGELADTVVGANPTDLEKAIKKTVEA